MLTIGENRACEHCGWQKVYTPNIKPETNTNIVYGAERGFEVARFSDLQITQLDSLMNHGIDKLVDTLVDKIAKSLTSNLLPGISGLGAMLGTLTNQKPEK